MNRFIRISRVLILILVTIPLYAFDHTYGDYRKILNAYVKEGRVDYLALQKDRADIDAFVKEIAGVTDSEYGSWSREQQLAYWINTYNGWFLQIIIDRYPIRGARLYGVSYPENSVQRIPNLWDNVKTKAAGREVSLRDIEHKILISQFREPRVHFAIVGAALGCPLLRTEPFHADSLDTQLSDAARAFINDPSKVQWDEPQRKLKISRIFDWYSSDFQIAADDSWKKLYSKRAGIVAFISRYLPAPVTDDLKKSKAKIEYLDYDWTLNNQ